MQEVRTINFEALREKIAEDCSICLCPKTEPVVILECDHLFDRECLRRAYLNENEPDLLRCPLCRHESETFGEIPNFDRPFIHEEPLWVLGLPAYPPVPSRTYLSPQITLDDELYEYLDRVVAQWQARRSAEQSDSGRVYRGEHTLAVPVDSGSNQVNNQTLQVPAQVVDDSRQVQSSPVAGLSHEIGRQSEDDTGASPVPGTSRTVDPLPSQQIRRVRSHTGRGRHISYEVEFSDGSVSSVPKSVIENTQAYREYYRKIRNEYQRVYLSRRRE